MFFTKNPQQIATINERGNINPEIKPMNTNHTEAQCIHENIG